MPANTRPHLERLEDRLAPAVTVTNQYTGLTIGQTQGFVPPDTCGAVGPSSYVESVNQTVAIYSPKTTGTTSVTDTLDDFYYTQGGLTKTSPNSEHSDPIVIYDEVTQQFVVGDQDVDFNSHISNFDLAVSKTNNPATLTSADWSFYSISTTEGSGGIFDADYPGNFGYNRDALVFTLNMFNTNTSGSNHVQVVSVSQSDLAAEGSSVSSFHNDFAGFSLRPTTMHDSTAGGPMWLLEEGGNNMSINVVQMTNELTNSASFVTTNVAVNAYTTANPPLNPDGSTITTNTDSRIMKAAEANNIIVACHQVANGSSENDARWYEFNVGSGTPVLQDQGQVSAGTNTYLMYPGIDINNQGDIAMSYARSGNDSSSDFMSVWVTGRTPTDAAGTMETPVLVKAGTTINQDGREGDLSSINVDADGSFWVANEFSQLDPTFSVNSWGTEISRVTLPSGPPVNVLGQFDALNVSQSGGAAPPDTVGGVGPNSYIETVNSQVSIFSKTGTTLATDNLNDFLITVGGLTHPDGSAFLGDADMVYDEVTGQFIVGDLDVDPTNGVSAFDFAVSKTSNPTTLTTSDWNFYQLTTTESGNLWSDYPGNIGYNHDALVINFNMFGSINSGGNYSGHSQIDAISQASLAAEGSTLSTFQSDVTVGGNAGERGLRPVTEHDSNAGDPMWLIGQHGDGASIDVYKMTNVLSNTPTFTATNLAVNPYTDVGSVPPLQPDGSAITFNTDSRIMKAAEANNTLVACHQVAVSGTQDDAQWYEIDVSSGTPTLKDQGDVSAGNNTYLMYPGIDINSQGAIAMSYSQSGTDSGNDFMSMWVTGRAPTDAAGTMRAPTLVKAGDSINFDGREGDFSGVNVDSDGTFWLANEYALANSWGTEVAHVQVPLTPAHVTGSYTGLTSASSTSLQGGETFVPPDTVGAAGPSSYVETVNQSVAITNKTTGAAIASDSLNDFFFTQGGLPRASSTSGLSDPIVAYDEFTGQFLVGDQDVDFSNHVSNFDLAVSKTSTPGSLTTADWNFYTITTTESGFDADYPGNFGYNHDAFVFTLNMFSTSGGAGHVQVNSVSQSSLAGGGALSTFQNDFAGFNLRPTTMHDAKAGDPMWLMEEQDGASNINVVKMTNILSNSASFTTTTLSVNPYTSIGISGVHPKQPDGTEVVGNIDSRIMKVAEANNTLVAAQAVTPVGSTTEDDARWYEISVAGGTPSLLDQGNISAGNNTYLYYPGIDINSKGDIAMSYMQSGTDTATDFMSMYVTGREPTDPAGTMGMPVLVQAGATNYHDFSSPQRAGDLSGINVDSDGSFWMSNEFANTDATANWGTAIAHVIITEDTAIVSGGVLQVTGDGTDNQFDIRLKAGDPTTTEVLDGTLLLGDFANATFSSISVHGLAGNDTLTVDSSNGSPVPSGGISYDGGSGNNTLVDANSVWTITGNNAGNIDGTITFSNTQNLTGGSGNDSFLFDNGFGVTGKVDGGGGTNTLDYSNYTTGVTVNLATGVATGTGSIANIANVTGGSGNDVLTGNSAANVLIGNAGNDTLTGGGGGDTYLFNTSSALGSDNIVDSSGTATVSFAGSSPACTFAMGSTSAQTINANLTLKLSSGMGILNAIGGNGNDVFSANGLNDTITGGNGNTTFTAGGGNDTFIGGSGNDTYRFNTSSKEGTDTITDTAGNNAITFGGSTAGCTLDLTSNSAQTVNSNLKLTLSAGTLISNVTGGSGNDVFTANGLSDSFHESAGSNTYILNTSNSLGTVSLFDTTGTGTISFAGSTAGCTVNLGSTSGQVVNSHLTLVMTSATGIQNVIGGTGADVFTGNTLNNTFTGNGGGDTYLFNTNTAQGTDTIVDSSGTATVSFAGSTSGVTLNLGSTSSQVVNSNLTLTLSSASGIQNVIGGTGADTFTSNSQNNTLTGGGGGDTYVFNTTTAQGSDTIVDNSGTATVSFAGSTPGCTFTLGSTAAQVVNSKLTLTLSSATGIQNVIGGSGADTLTGNTLNNTFTGNGGGDTYLFNTNTAQGSDTITDTSGTATVSFAGSTNAIVFSIGSTGAQVVNSNLTLKLSSAHAILNLIGGSGGNTLTGNNLANTLTGGAGNDTFKPGGAGGTTFVGGGGADSYMLNTNSAFGTDTIVDTSGKGTISFSGSSSACTLDLSKTTNQVVNSNLTLKLSSATGILNAIGGNGVNMLTGNGLSNTLTGGNGGNTFIQGQGTGRVTLFGGTGNDTYSFVANTQLGSAAISDPGGTNTLTFAGTTSALNVDLTRFSEVVNSNLGLILLSGSHFANLIAGSGNDVLTPGANCAVTGNGGSDTYLFNTSSQLGTNSITDGSGNAAISFLGSNLGCTFNASSTAQQTVNSNLKLTLSSGSTFNHITGGKGADVFTANSLNTTFTPGTGNDTFNGGSGNDSYIFNTTTKLGSDTITDSGGVNTVSFANSNAGCSFNMGSTSAQTVNGHLTLTLGSASAITTVIGGAGTDVLTGNNLNDTFTPGTGNATLNGGTGNDSYILNTNTARGTDTINDAGGVNTISFAGSTLGCTFNLGLTTAQTVNAHLTLKLTSASSITNLNGGNGNDVLTGNNLNNTIRGNGGVDFIFGGGSGNKSLFGSTGGGVVVGGTGVDSIIGGTGRSVLIGELGNDTVTGGANGDIVIGGSTNFDSNLVALQAIITEWQRTDIGYSQRIMDLRNGVVDANSQTDKLVFGSTVLDDGGQNKLRGEPVGTPEPGGAELDWFFANLASGHDTIADLDPNEVVN